MDTLTIPYKNPFGALFFCTGLDFLPDGRVAVCTCHGDVWLVSVDEKAATCSWQRFATGLYHPLGLKVVDGQVVVSNAASSRDSTTSTTTARPTSTSASTTTGTPAPANTLRHLSETDPEGNFYFFKTGDTTCPPAARSFA